MEYILSVGLRAADVVEVTASGVFPDSESALRASVELSNGIAFTIFMDGVPAGCFGAAPGEGCGIPWLLGTDLLVSMPVQFIRESRLWVSLLNSIYPVLANLVHEENTLSRRWLRGLGATFHETHQIGGLTFRRFELCATQ